MAKGIGCPKCKKDDKIRMGEFLDVTDQIPPPGNVGLFRLLRFNVACYRCDVDWHEFFHYVPKLTNKWTSKDD